MTLAITFLLTRCDRSRGERNGGAKVPENGTFDIAGETTRARRLRNVEKRRKIAPGSRCSQNQKYIIIYGGNSASEFVDRDFLFDFVYIKRVYLDSF